MCFSDGLFLYIKRNICYNIGIKAKEFLISTSIPISDISYICGFSDPNYFTRKFKQIIGEIPSDIRKRNNVSEQQNKRNVYYEEAYLT